MLLSIVRGRLPFLKPPKCRQCRHKRRGIDGTGSLSNVVVFKLQFTNQMAFGGTHTVQTASLQLFLLRLLGELESVKMHELGQ